MDTRKPYVSVVTAAALPDAMRFCAPRAMLRVEGRRVAFRSPAASLRRLAARCAATPVWNTLLETIDCSTELSTTPSRTPTSTCTSHEKEGHGPRGLCAMPLPRLGLCIFWV